jgi:hypothetical protein
MPWYAEPRPGTLPTTWSVETDSVKSVLDATTFCVLPSVLQVPVTIPLKTSEVKLPEKVPDALPD